MNTHPYVEAAEGTRLKAKRTSGQRTKAHAQRVYQGLWQLLSSARGCQLDTFTHKATPHCWV